jgi:hypothetical protein
MTCLMPTPPKVVSIQPPLTTEPDDTVSHRILCTIGRERYAIDMTSHITALPDVDELAPVIPISQAGRQRGSKAPYAGKNHKDKF